MAGSPIKGATDLGTQGIELQLNAKDGHNRDHEMGRLLGIGQQLESGVNEQALKGEERRGSLRWVGHKDSKEKRKRKKRKKSEEWHSGLRMTKNHLCHRKKRLEKSGLSLFFLPIHGSLAAGPKLRASLEACYLVVEIGVHHLSKGHAGHGVERNVNIVGRPA